MIAKKITKSIDKFKLNLKDKTVLTEAATGNFAVTPVIAGAAEATVYAFTKDSKYGSAVEAKKQTLDLARQTGVEQRINVIENIDDINLKEVDILTNTGLLRPINNSLISKLSNKCVIPLMWEPWEYRSADLDLEACHEMGIKVYGTNESDERLKTLDYIGYLALYLLLDNKMSPASSRVLLIGCSRFTNPVGKILKLNNYIVSSLTDYSSPPDMEKADAVIILEHEREHPIIGGPDSFVNVKSIRNDQLVIHICGNVSFENANFRHIPEKPASFGYMSYTADYVDSQAVIDLHTAGLKVAEGMLEANKLSLSSNDYKIFMERDYPALAFDDNRFW